ncbi:MAG: DUF3499 domain-containing protein [Nesterenkonia sp.]|uniref:DUF3499 domain-containing protein n=1 Tax=Nesterenkonia marinintestina TaxID=2979865 RepID=UPI0021BEEB8F|nr:DUF3499 domain-containing protein [Nesterenkonia sp. GX14115]MDO5492541.1 DUF3499 domain-containing protein [Nesterenkonia sp.]
MDSSRRCTRSGCDSPAVATLTYSYSDSTIVVGPMSTYAEPHTYDLCAPHADTMSAPRGWEVLRLEYPSTPPQAPDDLLAVADAVRTRENPTVPPAGGSQESTARESRGRIEPPASDAALTRGHLRLLRDD